MTLSRMVILSLVSIVLLLAACENVTGPDDLDDPEPSPDPSEEIEMWIGLGGELGERIQEMVDDFNESHDGPDITLETRGDYADVIDSLIEAYEEDEPLPHIAQIYEVGTGTIMAEPGLIYPVHELMEDMGKPFDTDDILEQIAAYYADADGNMLSFPFNSSTPVLYYNVDAFDDDDPDPDDPPSTWPEIEDAADYLLELEDHDFTAAITFEWPSWTQLENFAAWHDLPLATDANGIESWTAELVFGDHPDASQHFQHHWQTLADWAEDGVLEYGGRGGGGGNRFVNEEVPMYIASSAGYAGINANASFEFSATMLPYWPDIVDDGPQNSIIGGGSLWVTAGHHETDYEVIADFFEYLSDPQVQAEWHQFSGYLPVTESAREISETDGFYDDNPVHKTAIEQITLNEPTDNSRGIRLGYFPDIRNVILNELEALFPENNGDSVPTAENALKDAQEAGNNILQDFREDFEL